MCVCLLHVNASIKCFPRPVPSLAPGTGSLTEHGAHRCDWIGTPLTASPELGSQARATMPNIGGEESHLDSHTCKANALLTGPSQAAEGFF